MLGVLLNHRYKVIRELARGGCAATLLAEDLYLPSKRKAVVKQFKPAASNMAAAPLLRAKFEKEAEALELLGTHELIPELYGLFEENEELYIVQQWIEGETLLEYVARDGPFDQDFVRDFLVCTLSILEFVHSQKIVHRDIKPSNILLRVSDGMPVLIDFGVLKDLEETMISGYSNLSATVVGSVGYSPPEQFAGYTSYSNDLFSLGMIAIFLLTALGPNTLVDPRNGNLLWLPSVPNWEHLNRHLVNTIMKATNVSARDRFLSAKEMKKSLYNSQRGACQIFRPENHTPYMWKQTGNWRADLIESEYEESMKLHPEDSAIFKRGKSWAIF